MKSAADYLGGGVRFVAPAAVLGGGFSRRSFAAAMATKPDFLACDAGSTDWGPYYLGTATSWAGFRQTRRDLEPMILAALDSGAPLLLGSAASPAVSRACDGSAPWWTTFWRNTAGQPGSR